MSIPRISVVLATYEWPQALDVALEALSEQTDRTLEVVVADDGSGPETSAVVERWQGVLGERLAYVRHADEGWRLGRIRNLGALRAHGDYLVFLDGDCLVRRGFADAVHRAALSGWFLASKRLHLSARLSGRVLEAHLPVWRWSAASWVLRAPGELVSSHREAGSPGVIVPVRDRRRLWRPGQPDFVPPYDAYGFFIGIARRDFEAVNGFDMRYRTWGGEDRDLAVRLRRSGLRCGWPGPAATLLHLWHAPRKGTMPSNAALELETRASERPTAVEGLDELLVEVGPSAGGRSTLAAST